MFEELTEELQTFYKLRGDTMGEVYQDSADIVRKVKTSYDTRLISRIRVAKGGWQLVETVYR